MGLLGLVARVTAPCLFQQRADHKGNHEKCLGDQQGHRTYYLHTHAPRTRELFLQIPVIPSVSYVDTVCGHLAANPPFL